MGVRLNTYSDSIGPVRVLCPCTWHLNRLSSPELNSDESRASRFGAVQKLTAVNPWAIHSNEMTAAPIRSGLQFFADVPWGRMLQNLFIPRLCGDTGGGPLNEPGPGLEPFCSRPRRPTASDGRQPELPIKSTESLPRGKPLRGSRAQRRPAVLRHQ